MSRATASVAVLSVVTWQAKRLDMMVRETRYHPHNSLHPQVPVSEDEETPFPILCPPGNSGVSFEEVCQAIAIAARRALRWQPPISMANLILKLVQRLELVALNPVINQWTAVNTILRFLARVLPTAFETVLPGRVLPPVQQTDLKFADRLFRESKVKGVSLALGC